jgi:TP901 family phage tail tape measure protein
MVAEVRPFLIQFLAESQGAMSSIKQLVGAAGLASIPTTALWAGAALESVMVRVDTAIEHSGGSVSALTDRFHALGRAAGPMLEAAEAGAKAGIVGEEALFRFAEASRTWGKVTGQSTESAASGLAQMTNSLGYTVDQVENLTSSMFALSEVNSITVSTLQTMITQLGSVAEDVGVSTSALMALNVVLDAGGIKGRRAIQPIGKMLSMLEENKGAGADMASGIGLMGDEFEGFLALKPDQQIAKFMEGISKMDTDEAVQMITALHIATGTQARKLVSATKNGKSFTEALKEATDAEHNHSMIEKQAAAIHESVAGGLKDLWESLTAVGETVGYMLLPIMKAFSWVMTGLVDILRMVPTPILAGIAVLASLASGVIAFGLAMKLNLIGNIAEYIGYAKKFIAHLAMQVTAQEASGGSLSFFTMAQKAWTFATAEGAVASTAAAIATAGQGVSAGGAAVTTELLADALFEADMAAAAGVATYPMAAAGQAGMGVAAAGATVPTVGFTTALSALWAALWPITLVVLAVAASIGIMILAFKLATKWWSEGGETVKWIQYQLQMLKNEFHLVVDPIVEAGKRLWAALEPIKGLLLGIAAITIFPFLLPIITAVVAGFIWLRGAMQAIKMAFDNLGGSEALEPLRLAVLDLMDALSSAWSTIKEAFASLAGSLGLNVSLFEFFVGIAKGAVALVFVPLFLIFRGIVGVIAGVVWAVSGLINLFVWGKDIIAKSLLYAFAPIVAVYDAVMWLKESMFGSSFLHIKEGSEEVTPAVHGLKKSFVGVQRAAVGLDIDKKLPDEGALTRKAAGVAASSVGAAASPSSSSRETTTARITVPVTVELDGMILARVVAEHLVELGNERSFNEPNFPMRGIEPA